jgi:hypothetical protein
MTTLLKKEDADELTRALLSAGQIVSEYQIENNTDRKFLMVYKIGNRFWGMQYFLKSGRAAALVTLARDAIADIIVALRMQIEEMHAQLGEDCVKWVPADALSQGADLDQLAWKIMQEQAGVKRTPCFTMASSSKSTMQTNAVIYAFGDHVVLFDENDDASEDDMPTIVASKLGLYVAIRMMQEKDELENRCAKVAREQSRAALASSGNDHAEKRKRCD